MVMVKRGNFLAGTAETPRLRCCEHMDTHLSSTNHVAPLLSARELEPSPHLGSSISWSRLKVELGHGKKAKQILSGANNEGLSGELAGGQFCAIMGPSGAGKTESRPAQNAWLPCSPSAPNALSGRLPDRAIARRRCSTPSQGV